MKNWQLQDAKARLSELVKQTLNGPQHITVHGKSVAVVLSEDEYDRLTKTKISLVRLLRDSPLVGLDLDLKRNKLPCQDIDL